MRGKRIEHIQRETEKNISIMPPSTEDDNKGKEQPNVLRIAMYCRTGTQKQLQANGDEVSESYKKLSMN